MTNLEELANAIEEFSPLTVIGIQDDKFRILIQTTKGEIAIWKKAIAGVFHNQKYYEGKSAIREIQFHNYKELGVNLDIGNSDNIHLNLSIDGVTIIISAGKYEALVYSTPDGGYVVY